jgi:hypothetical protein
MEVPFRRGLSWFRSTDDEAEKVFTTYLHYLQQIAGIVSGHYGLGAALPTGLMRAIDQQPGIANLQQRNPTDEERSQIRRHLRIAWTRELRLQVLADQSRELLPDLLAGAPTDAYYAVYHAMLAFFSASSGPRITNHTAALRTIGNIAYQRNIFPEPWSVTCIGFPDTKRPQFMGLPSNASSVSQVHNLASPQPSEAWGSLCKALRTTRSRSLKEAKERWRQQNKRKRVPSSESKRLAMRMSPTSLFDFMYRLRTRCDYRDVDAFLEGISSPSEAESFLNGLLTLVGGTLALMEGLIAKYLKEDLYARLAEDFCRRVGSAHVEALEQRRAALSS